MKYISIDIETTGLDEDTCQILSIGAVIEDTEKQLPFEQIPKFHCVIPHTFIAGEPYALNLNKDLIELINKYHTAKTPADREELSKTNQVAFIYQDNVTRAFMDFMAVNGLGFGKTSISGKNYQGFDEKFLNKIPDWKLIGFHRRVADPAILFMDWQNDQVLPDLNTCKVRAGIEGMVSHNALEDAFDVVKILRTKY